MKIEGPVKQGDVFYFNGGYGKERPWLVLSVRKGNVIAVCMSLSEHEFVLTDSESRFYENSKICRSLSVFEEAKVKEKISFPYNNTRHLQEIKKMLRLTYKGLF